jgi:hypothetical protein
VRDQVGIAKDTKYQGEKIIGSGSEERKEIPVKYLPIQNPLRALQDNSFVRIDSGISPENAEIEKRKYEDE